MTKDGYGGYCKLQGYVLCRIHGEVHEKEKDPYEEGLDCSGSHQSVFALGTSEDLEGY